MLDLHRFNSIRGWFNEDEALWLYQTALGCLRCLELGSWQGRSTYTLLSAVRDTTGDPGHKLVVSVDAYEMLTEPIDYYEELKTLAGRQQIITNLLTNIEGFKSSVRHTLLDIPDIQAFPKLLRYPLFDLAFIDADHSEQAVCRNINQCLMLVRPGGLICGHDYRIPKGNEGVKRAVDTLLPERELQGGKGSCWRYRIPCPPAQLPAM